MTSPIPQLPPAGWYNDPERPGLQRYWTGANWTEITQAPQVKPKSPGGAAVASFLLPGLGQILNGDVGRGALMFVLALVSFLLIAVVIGIPIFIAMWAWSTVDAYNTAKDWNTQHGIVS